MEVWKIIFLSKWVICRFHVNLAGCKESIKPMKDPNGTSPVSSGSRCTDPIDFWTDFFSQMLAGGAGQKIPTDLHLGSFGG